jgi:hypothetical protein
MTGIILAGGKGTRLRPMTYITNKHLLPVYNKPMIDYPIQTLKDMGCDDILIISGGDHIGDFAEYLGNGSRYGLRFTYRVQPEAGGIAQALGMAEGFIDSHECFPVILGDNYFDKTPPMPNHPTIFVKEVDNPNRFGVLSDPYNGKFTTDMQNHWLASGHEVQRHTYYHPQLANEWADVIYFFTCDNNLLSATNPGSALLADDSNYHPWSLHQMDLTNKNYCPPGRYRSLARPPRLRQYVEYSR